MLFAIAKVKANSKANTVIEIVIINEVVSGFKNENEILKKGNLHFYKTLFYFTARTVAVKFQKNVPNFAVSNFETANRTYRLMKKIFYLRYSSNLTSFFKAIHF